MECTPDVRTRLSPRISCLFPWLRCCFPLDVKQAWHGATSPFMLHRLCMGWQACLVQALVHMHGMQKLGCPFVCCQVRRIEMQPGDQAVILASDGLWDVLSDSAAVATLKQARCLPRPRPNPASHQGSAGAGHSAPQHVISWLAAREDNGHLCS